MKREYTNFVQHSDGTFSGIYSVAEYEEFCILKRGVFTISGYYEATHRELVELLFLQYEKNDIVIRRIFEDCTFAFVDFIREEIDDVMQKLSSQKLPSQLYFSFRHCKVLSNGIEIKDYPLRYDETARAFLKKIPLALKLGATFSDVHIEYNLKKMTYISAGEKPGFSERYHALMKQWRKERYSVKRRKHNSGSSSSRKSKKVVT